MANGAYFEMTPVPTADYDRIVNSSGKIAVDSIIEQMNSAVYLKSVKTVITKESDGYVVRVYYQYKARY